MRFWKHAASDSTGAEIAEAAIVLPLVFMLLLGIYWFGRAYNIYATITYAAREGARAATAPTSATLGNTTLTPDQVATRVLQVLQASKLNPAQVTQLIPESAAERLHYSCAGDFVPTWHWWRKPANLLSVECADQCSDYADGTVFLWSVGQFPISLPVLFAIYFAQQPADPAQGQCADHRRKLGAST